ncbi:hypothetical protein B5F40_09950 [Gordonibacter sp. An230]|nr:hypothetical protein B5F40_09950 [Gordonibacter sp. An230]
MSGAKARALISSLRWHHVGFAFVWAVAFGGLSASADVDGSPIGEAALRLFEACQQVCVIAAVASAALAERRVSAFPPRLAYAAGVLLAAGALVFSVAFRPGGAPSFAAAALAGVLVGGATGFFYAAWQQFFASEGASRTAICIPLSAVLSALVSAVLGMLPDGVRIACVVGVLPVASAATLRLSLSEIVPADPPARMSRALAAAAARVLWKPVFCTCAVGFAWQLVAGLFSVSADASSAAGLGGLALASAAVLLIELFSERGFEALRVYQVLFPLVTGVLMLPPLLGVQFAPLLVGMLLLGFEVLNLLLIVTCAVYSSERGAPAAQTYVLCVGPTLAAMFAGDAVGKGLGPIVAYDFSLGVNVLFLCVYALSMVLLFMSFCRHGRRSDAAPVHEGTRIDVAVVGGSAPLAEPASLPEPGASGTRAESDRSVALDARCDALGLAEPFSPREREVVALVLRGNNVPAIARKLYISENTARDHMKSIYRKAGVHSRQELVDLLD